MNYRHAYHAGNFADVLKHVVLMLCLDHLKRKPAPFRAIDTHAGSGRYRLDADQAEITGEWRSGIATLCGPDAQPLPPDAAAAIEPYVAAVAAENTGGALVVYPGSPVLIQSALRSTDVLVANELHPDERAALENVLANDRTCRVTSLDGYAALKALLPPPERRGLVLIDPPFEEPAEFKRITTGLTEALKRFANGIYLVWYPIKDEKNVASFHRHLLGVTATAGLEAPLCVELLLRPARNPMLLNGCGVIVVNAPFTLKSTLEKLLPLLVLRMADEGKGSASVRALDVPRAPPQSPSPAPRSRSVPLDRGPSARKSD